MPAKYEAIRDECVKQKGEKRRKLCQAMAARIYNAQRRPGEEPVTGRKHE